GGEAELPGLLLVRLELLLRDVAHHDSAAQLVQRLGEPARPRADLEHAHARREVRSQVVLVHVQLDLFQRRADEAEPLRLRIAVVERGDVGGVVLAGLAAGFFAWWRHPLPTSTSPITAPMHTRASLGARARCWDARSSDGARPRAARRG